MNRVPVKVETSTMLREIPDTSGLERLSYTLRHPEMWPTNFVWDFSDCKSCAMGLSFQLWRKLEERLPPSEQHERRLSAWVGRMAATMEMPYEDAQRIFLFAKWAKRHWWNRGPDFKAITPGMVADEIDRYIISRK